MSDPHKLLHILKCERVDPKTLVICSSICGNFHSKPADKKSSCSLLWLPQRDRSRLTVSPRSFFLKRENPIIIRCHLNNQLCAAHG
jgi:hypothetical protein